MNDKAYSIFIFKVKIHLESADKMRSKRVHVEECFMKEGWPLRVAFQGEIGTYSEMAVYKHFGLKA